MLKLSFIAASILSLAFIVIGTIVLFIESIKLIKTKKVGSVIAGVVVGIAALSVAHLIINALGAVL